MKVVLDKELEKMSHRLESAEALLAGLAQHNKIETRVLENYKGSDLHISFGYKGGANNLVIENGFINDYSLSDYAESRRRFISTVWRGDSNYGEWKFGDKPDDRVKKHKILMKPWKSGEIKNALIFYQCSGDKAVVAAPGSYPSYMRSVVKKAEKTFKNILVRAHPRQPERIARRNKHTGTLQEGLSWADVGISFSSTTAIDCILNGIPAITLNNFSPAWEVSSHSLESVIRPSREQWLNNLMYAQWTHDELISGEFWEHIQEGYCP